ncbi:MAG: GNAT family N-acetyltransferase [Myxococcota bacterium]
MDIDAMHQIRLAVRENRLSDPRRVQPKDYQPFLRDDGRTWVVRSRGRIVGFAAVDVRRANVWALFVDPDHEGRGVGRLLHDTMMAWFFGHAHPEVWLSTEPGTRAERFYCAAGWRRTGQASHGDVRFEMTRAEWIRRNGT